MLVVLLLLLFVVLMVMVMLVVVVVVVVVSVLLLVVVLGMMVLSVLFSFFVVVWYSQLSLPFLSTSSFYLLFAVALFVSTHHSVCCRRHATQRLPPLLCEGYVLTTAAMRGSQ